MHRVLTGLRARRGAALVTLLSTAGCLGSMPPPPPLLQVPGVKTELTGFHRETVTSLTGAPVASRIMQIARDPTGDLVVVAEKGLRWVNPERGTTRDVLFNNKFFRHRLVTLPDRRRGIAGFSGTSSNPAVRVVDLTGKEVLRLSERSLETRISVANVTAGPDVEVLIPHHMEIRIFDMTGTLLTTVSSPRYMTIKTLVQADDDEAYEIAFVGTSLRKGPIEALIMNADGSVISEWSDNEGGWLSFVPEIDDTKLWGITSEGFTAWNTQGQRVITFPAPDADYLRFVIGTKFKGHTVLIGSGGGYSNLSLLCVFDDQRRLVYQEVFPFRTYATFADPDGSDFFVGVGYDVVRYSIADPAIDKEGDR